MGRETAMSLTGMSAINVELTSKCHRHTKCGFCYHQANPGLRKGDMPMSLLKDIRSQLSPGILLQLHRDGDPLCFPALGEALDLFDGFIRSIVTHGETLAEQADELIERCEAVTVSVFAPDADADMQYQAVREFLAEKGDRLPRVLIKVVGGCDVTRYEELGLPILRRRLHTEMNDRYVRTIPVLPESGICQDFLSKPAIAWDGKVYQCVRFDDTDAGYLGSLYEYTLDEIWNGPLRQQWMQQHIAGRRDLASPRCAQCTYYGIPVAS